jgi:hypothetical protein
VGDREGWDGTFICRASDVNFAGFGEEGDSLVRAAYGDNYARLAQIKAKYVPQNLFRHSQNIKLAG